MSALSKILRKQAGGRVAWWCPACDEAHAVTVEGTGAWTWDGNVEAPTFAPSVLVTGFELTHAGRAQLSMDQVDGTTRGDGYTYDRKAKVCHSFVKEGRMDFLGDCTHAMAGRAIPIPNWPDHYDDGDGTRPTPRSLS